MDELAKSIKTFSRRAEKKNRNCYVAMIASEAPFLREAALAGKDEPPDLLDCIKLGVNIEDHLREKKCTVVVPSMIVGYNSNVESDAFGTISQLVAFTLPDGVDIETFKPNLYTNRIGKSGFYCLIVQAAATLRKDYTRSRTAAEATGGVELN
jgi:hypothetical protein